MLLVVAEQVSVRLVEQGKTAALQGRPKRSSGEVPRWAHIPEVASSNLASATEMWIDRPYILYSSPAHTNPQERCQLPRADHLACTSYGRVS